MIFSRGKTIHRQNEIHSKPHTNRKMLHIKTICYTHKDKMIYTKTGLYAHKEKMIHKDNMTIYTS